MSTIDLRSDTVTLPTEDMLRAMTSAPLGDDVFGEDPTVRRLEETAADELMLNAQIYDQAARRRSFEIAAEVRDTLRRPREPQAV